MSIQIELQGFEEALALLNRWERQLSSGELLDLASASAAEEFRRYAVSISPVVTGAYRGAHVVVQQRMAATMTIDSGAVNPTRGVPVTRYAVPVEERHAVYQRTFNQSSGRAAVAGIEVIREGLR